MQRMCNEVRKGLALDSGITKSIQQKHSLQEPMRERSAAKRRSSKQDHSLELNQVKRNSETQENLKGTWSNQE